MPMARSNYSRKKATKPKAHYMLVFRRIFSRPKTLEDLIKQALLFVLYFWPSIYFTVTGTWLE